MKNKFFLIYIFGIITVLILFILHIVLIITDLPDFGPPESSAYGFSTTFRVVLIGGLRDLAIGLMSFYSYIFRESCFERELDTKAKSSLIGFGCLFTFMGVSSLIGIM